jgi:hypothetical protein
MTFDTSRIYFKDGLQISSKWSSMIGLLVGQTWTNRKYVAGDETRHGRKVASPIPSF